MIAFDLAYELTLGAVCATLDRPPRPARAFLDGLLVSALVYAPFCAASFAAFPGWQSMYLLDLDRIPYAHAWFTGLMTFSLIGSYLLGYVASRPLLRRARHRLLVVLLLSVWALLLPFLFGVLRSRALWVTTYQTFHASPPPPLTWGSPGALLGGPVTSFLALSALANAAALLWLFARARRLASRASLAPHP